MLDNNIATNDVIDRITDTACFTLIDLYYEWQYYAEDEKTDDANAMREKFSITSQIVSEAIPKLCKPLSAIETWMRSGNMLQVLKLWNQIRPELGECGPGFVQRISQARLDSLSEPPVGIAMFFASWLKDIERGAIEDAQRQVDDFGCMFISSEPEVPRRLGILLSAMRLGNVQQAKNLWPELESMLMTVHSEPDDRDLKEYFAATGISLHDITDEVANGSRAYQVEATTVSSNDGETGTKKLGAAIPVEFRTESMTMKERAAEYFKDVDWTIDHKAKVLRQMMDNGEIRFEMISARRWHFDKREI